MASALTIGYGNYDINIASYSTIESAFNDALEKANNTTHRRIYLAGNYTYQLQRPIKINSSGIIIDGDPTAVLTVETASQNNFYYAYMLQGRTGNEYDVEIKNITIRGNSAFGDEPTGGGVLLINNWKLLNVTVDTASYFGVFLGATADGARVEKCKFRGRGSFNDLVGGGGGTSNCTVAYNLYDANTTCSPLTVTEGNNITFQYNTVFGSGNVIMEGVDTSYFSNNTFLGGNAVVIANDKGYYYGLIRNSPNATVENNSFISPDSNTTTSGAIHVKIDGDYPTNTIPTVQKGGNVTIQNNTVINYPRSGILFTAPGSNYFQNGFYVGNNTISDCNRNNESTYNTGLGIIKPSGINILQTNDILLEDNTISDSRNRINHGVHIGNTTGTDSYLAEKNITLRRTTVSGQKSEAIKVQNPTFSTNIVIQTT